MADEEDTRPRLPLLVSAVEAFENDGEDRIGDFFVREIGWIEGVSGIWSHDDWETTVFDLGPPSRFSMAEVVSTEILAVRWALRSEARA